MPILCEPTYADTYGGVGHGGGAVFEIMGRTAGQNSVVLGVFLLHCDPFAVMAQHCNLMRRVVAFFLARGTGTGATTSGSGRALVDDSFGK